MIEYIISSGLYRIFGYFFLALLILVILAVISYFMRDRLIANLVYSRTFSEKGVYEGEEITMTETVYNKNWLPMFFVNVEAYIYGELEVAEYQKSGRSMQYFLSRFHLMPFMQIKRKHKIICTKRGHYSLDTVDIYYQKRVKYLSSPLSVYVYPKVIDMPKSSYPLGILQGDCPTANRLIADPFSLAGIRDYNFSDPFNTINFKASAKNCFAGGMSASFLKVNQRDFCSSRTIMVYLNFQNLSDDSIPTDIYEKIMEDGLSYACSIVRQAIYEGYRVGFAANCRMADGELSARYSVESGEIHLLGILRTMAEIVPQAGVSITSVLDCDILNGLANSEVYFISLAADNAVEQRLFDLQKNNAVSVIPLEIEELNI